jgi:hypothetical protein
VGCLPMVRDVPLFRESRLRVCFHGFLSRSYRFSVSRKIVFVFGFMPCLPTIRSCPFGSRKSSACLFLGVVPFTCIDSSSLEKSCVWLVS